MTTDIVPSIDDTQKTVDLLTFDELMGLDEHFRLPGFSELNKAELLGVPLIVTGLTWWMSKKIPGKDFVSCEATIGSENALKEAIRRNWVPNVTDLEQLRFTPEERVVFSDGSTGIRRQVTGMCHRAKMIDVGTTAAGPDGTEWDGRDESVFDKPFPEWTSFEESREQGDFGTVPTVSKTRNGKQFILRALRGLAVSNYSNEHTLEGETYYLR